jgi:hypothetical protein
MSYTKFSSILYSFIINEVHMIMIMNIKSHQNMTQNSSKCDIIFLEEWNIKLVALNEMFIWLQQSIHHNILKI